MNVRPIIEVCRMRRLLQLPCTGCEYRGSDCDNFSKLLGVRIPGEASKLGPASEVNKEIKNGCKR